MGMLVDNRIGVGIGKAVGMTMRTGIVCVHVFGMGMGDEVQASVIMCRSVGMGINIALAMSIAMDIGMRTMPKKSG